MKRSFLITVFVITTSIFTQAQYMYPISEYSSEIKELELSNFDISDTILYLPLGVSGLHIFNIADIGIRNPKNIIGNIKGKNLHGKISVHIYKDIKIFGKF